LEFFKRKDYESGSDKGDASDDDKDWFSINQQSPSKKKKGQKSHAIKA